jgi:hypothetical protein
MSSGERGWWVPQERIVLIIGPLINFGTEYKWWRVKNFVDYYLPPLVILLPPEQYKKFHLLLCALQGLVQISFWKTILISKLSFTVMVLQTCQVVTCMHLIAASVYWTRWLQATSTWKYTKICKNLPVAFSMCVCVCVCVHVTTQELHNRFSLKLLQGVLLKFFTILKLSWTLDNSNGL